MSIIAVIILCIYRRKISILEFYSRLKRIFVKVYIFSLTDINIRAVIILFPIHLPSIHSCGICDLFT